MRPNLLESPCNDTGLYGYSFCYCLLNQKAFKNCMSDTEVMAILSGGLQI